MRQSKLKALIATGLLASAMTGFAAVAGAPVQPACLQTSLSAESPSNLWYTQINVSITNNCPNTIEIDQALLSFASNAQSVSTAWGGTLSSSQPSYSQGIINTMLQDSGAGQSWGSGHLTTGRKVVVSFGVNLAGQAFNLAAAQQSLQVIPNGSLPDSNNGEIDIHVDPTGVSKVSGAEAIHIVSGQFNQIVTNSNWATASVYKVTGLAYGNYTISADALTGYNAVVSPTTVNVNNANPHSVTITYKPQASTGSVKITLPQNPLGATNKTVPSVSVSLKDTSVHPNQIYTQNVIWGHSAQFDNLPAGDNVSASVPASVTDGQYVSNLQEITNSPTQVVANSLQTMQVVYGGEIAVAKIPVLFNLSGLGNANAAISLVDKYGNNYSYPNLGNGTVTESLPINNAYTISASAPGMNTNVTPSQLNVGTTSPATPITVSFSATPASSTYFSPYVDLGTFATWYPTVTPWDLTKISTESGVKSFRLAFITQAQLTYLMDPKTGIADIPSKTCMPNIAGIALPYGQDLTNNLKATNISYVMSFGGAAGMDVAQSCYTIEQNISTQSQLFQIYQNVINTYQPNGLDFDIEGAFVADTPANEAIWAYMFGNLKLIQDQNPALTISLTLPVMPYGLNADGQAVVKAAQAAGLQNFQVNLMTMDYGAPTVGEDMGQNAIDAATNTFNFLQGLYPSVSSSSLWARIAVTPMIGLNDTGEQFSIQNARTVQAFATKNGLAFTSMWSINRDYPCGYTGDGLTHNDQASCSGGSQYQTVPFEFSAALNSN